METRFLAAITGTQNRPRCAGPWGGWRDSRRRRVPPDFSLVRAWHLQSNLIPAHPFPAAGLHSKCCNGLGMTPSVSARHRKSLRLLQVRRWVARQVGAPPRLCVRHAAAQVVQRLQGGGGRGRRGASGLDASKAQPWHGAHAATSVLGNGRTRAQCTRASTHPAVAAAAAEDKQPREASRQASVPVPTPPPPAAQNPARARPASCRLQEAVS